MHSSNSRSVPHLREGGPVGEWRESFVDRIVGADRLVVMTDFDGTLSEISDDPDAAAIRPDARTALSTLVDRPHIDVAVVSGRALSDVRSRVGLEDIWYVGNHGLEIDIGERQFVHPDAEETTDLLQDACTRLRDQLADIDDVVIEEKGLTATIHYRMVEDESDVARIQETVRSTANRQGGMLRMSHGKEILELRPDIDWDKGCAVTWIVETIQFNPQRSHLIYIGDDVTDESGFRAVTEAGTAVFVGDSSQQTAADYRVECPAEIVQLLTWLAKLSLRYSSGTR